MKYSTTKLLLNSLQLLLTVALAFSFSACGSSQKESVDESDPSTYDSVYDGYKKGDGKKKPESKPVKVEDEAKEPVTPTPDVKKPVKDPVVNKPEVKPETKPERAEPVTLDETMARYIEESEAAFDASNDYASTEGKARDEAYVVWAEHMYAALGYANIYAARGGKLEDLPELRELKILKAGNFKNALGPSDDPRVKAAIKKWQESTK